MKWNQDPLLIGALVKGQAVVAKRDGNFCRGVISKIILPTQQTPKKKKFVRYEIDWVKGGRGSGYNRNARGKRGKLHVYTGEEFDQSSMWCPEDDSGSGDSSWSGTAGLLRDSSSDDSDGPAGVTGPRIVLEDSRSDDSDEPAGVTGVSSNPGRSRYLNAGDKVIAQIPGMGQHFRCGTVHRRSIQHGRFKVRWDETGELSEGSYHNDNNKVDRKFAYSRAQFLRKFGAQILAEVDIASGLLDHI